MCLCSKAWFCWLPAQKFCKNSWANRIISCILVSSACVGGKRWKKGTDCQARMPASATPQHLLLSWNSGSACWGPAAGESWGWALPTLRTEKFIHVSPMKIDFLLSSVGTKGFIQEKGKRVKLTWMFLRFNCLTRVKTFEAPLLKAGLTGKPADFLPGGKSPHLFGSPNLPVAHELLAVSIKGEWKCS